MGVPKFAGWLTKKYPAMLSKVVPTPVYGLYVDLNGLIHPCCHDEDDPSVAARPEKEKIRQICLAVDTLVSNTLPSSVLYIAIDGVAPRAKMNQQRARRYMSFGKGADDVELPPEAAAAPSDVLETERELDAVRRSLQSDLYGGLTIMDENEEDGLAGAVPHGVTVEAAQPVVGAAVRHDDAGKSFDSNCISPGTEFMTKVSMAMQLHIQERLQESPQWRALTVVFSDASTPGEGEHKLLDFIRAQSSYPGSATKGYHVVAGLDADLILLTLSLHLPRVVILRDIKRPSTFSRKSTKHKGVGRNHPQQSSEAAPTVDTACMGTSASAAPSSDEIAVVPEGSTTSTASDNDAEEPRAANYEYFDIDIVGTSIVSEIYGLTKLKCIRWMMNPAAAPEVISAGGYYYDHVGGDPDEALRKDRPQQRQGRNAHGVSEEGDGPFNPCTAAWNSKIIDDFIVLAMILGNDFMPRLPSAFCGDSAMDNLIEVYVGEVLPYGFLTDGHHEINLQQLGRFFAAYAKVECGKFRVYCIREGRMPESAHRLPLDSSEDVAAWQQPYMESTGLAGHMEEACRTYIGTMRFVWRYYSSTSAACSWSWYYPFHYAPLARHLAAFLAAHDHATLAPPPVELAPPDAFSQLLCILPPPSAGLLPAPLADVMHNPHNYEIGTGGALDSTFPREWLVDHTAAYGKGHLATVLLPFANMERLKAIVKAKEGELSKEEMERLVSRDYHLVFQRSIGGGDSGPSVSSTRGIQCALRGDIQVCADVSVSATETRDDESTRTHHVEGLTVPLQPGITCFQLRDSPPRRIRPKTYSFTALIPNVTVLPDGTVYSVMEQRRRRRGKDANGSPGSTATNPAHSGQANAARTDPQQPPSLAEFYICISVAVMGGVVLTHGLSGTLFMAVVQMAAVLLVGFMFLFILGIAVRSPVKGSGMTRNSIRFTFVDWQCGRCLARNFSRNTKCFKCYAPFDPQLSWAVYSHKMPPTPPLLEPDHTKLLEKVILVDRSSK